MSLPYSARLVCLLAIVVGATCLPLQMALAAASRPVLRWLEGLSARRRERSLFWIQMGPLAVAALFAVAFCLPEYVGNETNLAPENISLACIFLACAVMAWLAWPAAKTLRLALRTVRFSRACRRLGTRLDAGTGEIPVMAVPEPDSLVALVGLLRPSILISRRLLDSGELKGDALAAALDHERAHAAQRDNWKLLALNLLPRIPRESWLQLWRQSAEWAADDDAVKGDPERSLVLAETLVRMARLSHGAQPALIQTALCFGETDLRARVDRLLRPAQRAPRRGISLSAVTWSIALAAAATAAAVSPWLYSLSEHILHLG